MKPIPFFLVIGTLIFIFAAVASVLLALSKILFYPNQTETNESDENRPDRIDILIFALAFLSGVIGLGFFIYGWSIRDSFEGLHELGDFLGGTTGTFWAAAGTLLFVLALKLQRDDLILTKIEMRRANEESAAQTAEFELKRITDIIFKQTDFVYHFLQSFRLGGLIHRRQIPGINNIYLLSGDLKNFVTQLKSSVNESELRNSKNQFFENFASVYQLLDTLLTSLKVVKNSIENATGISSKEKQELFSLFKSNFSKEVWSIVSNASLLLSKIAIEDKENDQRKKMLKHKVDEIQKLRSFQFTE